MPARPTTHALRQPPLAAPLLWQVYTLFWIAGLAATAWPVPAGVCALLWLAADARLWRAGPALCAALCLLAGLAVGRWQLYGSPLPAALPPAPEAERTATRLCGEVRDVRGLSDNRLRILLGELRTDSPQGGHPPHGRPGLPGLALWTWEQPVPLDGAEPLPGQTVCVTRRLRPALGLANPGLADWGLSLAAQGVRWRLWSQGDAGAPRVTGQATASARWREGLRQRLVHLLATGQPGNPSETARAPVLSQGRAMLPALLFGDRRYLTQATLDRFAAAALAHSLALSGQHLAVAALAGLCLVLATARLAPGLYLARPRPLLVLWAGLPPALLYLWLGNAPASLLRAAAMLAALAILLARGRPATTLDALFAALAAISAGSPLCVLDTGFQLSALCVATIGAGLPWLRRISPPPGENDERSAPGRLARCLWALKRIVLISLLIQTALLPLNLLLFGNPGHWCLLNALWLPVLDMLTLPCAVLGLLLSALGLDALAGPALTLAALPCQWMTDGLAWLDARGWLDTPALLRPHWTALPAFAALLAALAMRPGRSAWPPAARRLLALGTLLLCVGPALRAAERVSPHICLDVLDVGQSQALALRLPGHARLLLDGGGSASPRFEPGRALVGPALTSNDAPRLAAVLNSHPDLDHMGGLPYILDHFDCGPLLDNGRDGRGRQGELWAQARHRHGARPLARGDVIELPTAGLRLEILHPPRSAQDLWRGNNASLVMRLSWRGRGLALFPGDAELPVLRHLLACGDDLSAEVLVAPHHGSRGSVLPAFLAAVKPALVVASCGLGNRYGYPAQALKRWCAAHGATLLDTGRHGAIRVTWPGDGRDFAAPRAQAQRPPGAGAQ